MTGLIRAGPGANHATTSTPATVSLASVGPIATAADRIDPTILDEIAAGLVAMDASSNKSRSRA